MGRQVVIWRSNLFRSVYFDRIKIDRLSQKK